MDRNEITRIAREAGFVGMDGDHGALRRFAALVAKQAYLDGVKSGISAEREACAAILDANAEKCVPSSTFMQLLRSNAAAIRARGNQ